MSPSRVLFFANPRAGNGAGGVVARRLEDVLARRGLLVQTIMRAPSTLRDSDLLDVQRAEAIVTVGGDGTLRGAAERLLASVDDEPSKLPPLLVVPLGTANLMSRHLTSMWHGTHYAEEIAAAIERQKVRPLDAARANGRLFLLMAGVGLDATVVHELDRLRSGPIALTSYALPAVLALRNYQFPPISITMDGRSVLENTPALAFIGNVAEYGTGFPILTQARSDDGELDLCVLPYRSITDLPRLLMTVTTGDHIHEEGAIYTRGKSFQITARSEVPVQLDGDSAGHTPLNIEMLPSRLRLLVR